MAFAALLNVACPVVKADIGVVLSESIDQDVARITGAGHSAVYLSNVCPASPVKLRLCGPGENGSVISNYKNFDEDEQFQWNIFPLNVFLYGVSDPQDRPLFGSRKIKMLLEEQYRERALQGVCDRPPCTTNKYANWRYGVGSTFERSLYIFVVHTTTQQDQELIDNFNNRPNRDHFNGFTQNCADFTKDVVDKYFPHSARRDFINDFGMTSPKAVARSFAHYAERQPDDDYRVIHFSQLPGTIKRSNKNREGTEQLFHAKKWLIPLAAFASHELLPAAMASYMLLGRFNPQREYENHPEPDAAELERQAKLARDIADSDRAEYLRAELKLQRTEIIGDPGDWSRYRGAYNTLVKNAAREGIIADEDAVNHVFKKLDHAGKPMLDANGELWLNVTENGETRRVGLTPSNIFAPGSDYSLAYQLILARISAELASPSHSRENILEFKNDWALLQHARPGVVTSVTLRTGQ